MEIHNLCIHRRAPAVILEVFWRGKAVRGQPLYAFLTRCRIGVHIAQRRQLTAHFSKQLLTAAQISRLLPSGRHADCMLPQRYRLLLENTQLGRKRGHSLGQRRQIRITMLEHARLQQRQKHFLNLVHHIDDLLTVVIRPDYHIDEQRHDQTDQCIGKSVETVHN